MTFFLSIPVLLYSSTLLYVSALNSSQYQAGQLSGILYSGPELSWFYSYEGKTIPELAGRDDTGSYLWSEKWVVFKRWSCESKHSRQPLRFSREIGR